MKSKGFTLIELMVVVALIALLTSVVAALIGEGRDKARIQAFRSEVDQMVKAIELYRSDTGRLPGEGSGLITYSVDSTGSIDNTGGFDLKDILANSVTPYLQAIPKPPFEGEMSYAVNLTNSRCEGNSVVPEYLIWVRGERNIEYFMDWPALVVGGTPDDDVRCFSIQ